MGLSEWTSVLANVATFLGIPIAIVLFLNERRREREERNRARQDRELTKFLTLNSLYIDYLRLCIDDPQLPCVEMSSDRENEQGRKHSLHMNIVVSMLETAYFLYADEDTAFKQAQWSGWRDYIACWIQHPVYGALLPEALDQYDARFVAEVNKIRQGMATLIDAE